MNLAEPAEPTPEPISGLYAALSRYPRLRQGLLRLLAGGFPLRWSFPLKLLGRPLSRSEIGWVGERLAARHLRRNGRRLLYRNYAGLHRGEVDIVARHGRVLTFVEVKTRTSDVFGRPSDAVTADKQRLIRRGASDWLRLLGNPRIPTRFDIVEVLLIRGSPPRLNIIENAFTFEDASMQGR